MRRLIDLARQVAADAIVLKQEEGRRPFLMRTTPLDYLGRARADRADEYVVHVLDHETLDDVDAVAMRILPLLTRAEPAAE